MNDNSMVNEINNLIANILAAGGAVFLPGVGSLFVECKGARQISKSSIFPPYRTVSFSSDQIGESLVAVLARAAQCDSAQAQEIYDRWLARTFQASTLTIAGTGVLQNQFFSPTPSFDLLINPQGNKPLRISSGSKRDWVIWISVIAILFAIGFTGYEFMQRPSEDGLKSNVLTTSVQPEVAVEPYTVVEGQIDLGASTSENTPSATNSAANGTENPTSTIGDGTAAPTSAGTSSETTSQSKPNEAQELVSGRRYVVFGVYSTAKNAFQAVKELKSANVEGEAKFYVSGNKFVVSAFNAADEASCNRYIADNRYQFPELWILTAR